MNRAALRRAARTEWGPLAATVTDAITRERFRAIPMTLSAVALTAAFQVVQNQSWGFGPVQAVGSVRAELPWWLALLRTPLSLFVPALDLPVWGALAQVLIVFGISEICLGPWRTLAVAYVATLAGTMYARLAIALGPGLLGLPPGEAKVVDTGPSAAVVGLAVYVSWRYRAWGTCAVVVLAMVAEVVLKPNLAGKEHIAAVLAMLALSAADELRRRRRKPRDDRFRDGDQRSGAPATRS
ncbi:hypothetical protein [Streptomyces sp. I05A-00742]|uniref:hypothetical protein n=1 Tax=Streptomyces sp. I05A-00742 TaxID=2732853 RepID=UPI001489FD3B|nr:hypothetical protein [Streptomyces sp. I05A-00742]